jgi:hypothetical protein
MLSIKLLWDIDCYAKQVRRIRAHASIGPEVQFCEAYSFRPHEEACFESFARESASFEPYRMPHLVWV